MTGVRKAYQRSGDYRRHQSAIDVVFKKDKTKRYFVLTPWAEKAQGITAVMAQEEYLLVEAAKETNLTETEIKARIARCDVFMLGTLSTTFSSVESTVSSYKPQPDGAAIATLPGCASRDGIGEKYLHLSLQAPYDTVNFAEEVDTAIASYSYYGYENDVLGSRAVRHKKNCRLILGIIMM